MQSVQDKAVSSKLFKFNYSIGVHPLFLVILIFLSGNFIYVSTSTKPHFNVGKPHFRLTQSNAFKAIVKCSDKSDGIKCFQEYHNELSEESRNGMSKISFTQLERFVRLLLKHLIEHLLIYIVVLICYLIILMI